MTLTQILSQFFDLRSFSSLWYWLSLAAIWSMAAHWGLGVPYDQVRRARRRGGAVAEDLHELVRLNVARILWLVSGHEVALTALGSFMLSSLVVIGFGFGIEFFQAVALILVPLSVVGALSLVRARQIAALIAAGRSSPDEVIRQLRRHRLYVRLIGTLALLVTGFWGMLQNIEMSVLN